MDSPSATERLSHFCRIAAPQTAPQNPVATTSEDRLQPLTGSVPSGDAER